MLLGDRYELRDALGRGGMATVYRAWDTKLERQVAVKVFSQPGVGGEDRERRLREMRLLSGLSHPHLVTLFDAEWPEPSAAPDGMGGFLVMELVDGENLRRRIDRDGADSALMTRLAGQLSGALAYLHGRGIVHRDLKPENILLTDAPGGGAVNAKLVDFGIAQLVGDERLTTAGTVLGTAAYLSPEQVTGQGFGPAADVYALGLVLLECLTGTRAYPGTSVESAVARLSRSPEIPAETPESWRELLTRMTASDPAARPTAAQVADAVRDAPSAWPLAAAGAGAGAGAAAAAAGAAGAAAGDEAGQTRRYPTQPSDPTAATERLGPAAAGAAGAAAAGAAAGAAGAGAAAASSPTAPTVAMTSAGTATGTGATAPTSAAPTPTAPAAAGTTPPNRRRGRIIALVIAAVLVAAAIVVALVLWLGGSHDDSGPSGSPVPNDSASATPSTSTSPSEGRQPSTAPSAQPSQGGASQQPSQEPSQEATEQPSQQPSEQPSATTAPTVKVTVPATTAPTG